MTPPPFPQVRKKHPQKAPSLIRVKWSCQEDISLGILKSGLYPFKFDFFARIVNAFKSTFCFCRKFHRRCLKGPEETSDLF